jgi:hypothetical protein
MRRFLQSTRVQWRYQQLQTRLLWGLLPVQLLSELVKRW